MPRVILDLSHDELGIVLRHLPDAEDIAHAAEVCKAFKVGSQRATAARIPLTSSRRRPGQLCSATFSERRGEGGFVLWCPTIGRGLF